MNYRDHPALNHSKLKYLDKTKYVPEDYHARFIANTIPQETTPAMEFGTLFHLYALQPHLVHEKVAMMPEFSDLRKKENKEAKLVWEQENIGKIHIDNKTHLQLNAMVYKLHNHKAWIKNVGFDARQRKYCTDIIEYEKEVYFKYKDIECKAQLDIYNSQTDEVYDVKTVDNIDKSLFINSIEKYGYDTQAAFYMEAVKAESYTLIVCCKQAPYHVRFFKLPMDYLLRAKRKNEQRLELYKQCMLWNDWAGYSEEVEELEIPSWNMKE
jgi:hypothetical protein